LVRIAMPASDPNAVLSRKLRCLAELHIHTQNHIMIMNAQIAEKERERERVHIYIHLSALLHSHSYLRSTLGSVNVIPIGRRTVRFAITLAHARAALLDAMLLSINHWWCSGACATHTTDLGLGRKKATLGTQPSH
jgi:hypothetical protein